MKTLGLIGGTSWVSTQQYYLRLNQMVGERMPGHNALIAMWSTDFGNFPDNPLEWRYQHHLKAAQGLAGMGADAIMICSNTLHMFVDRLEQDQPLPIIHLVDALGATIRAQGWTKAALLGTRTTMTLPFYSERLARQGVETLVPDAEVRDEIDRTIYEELTLFKFLPETQAYYQQQIQVLKDRGAECVILGCTEIPLLMEGVSSALPMLDTIEVHCQSAVDFALEY